MKKIYILIVSLFLTIPIYSQVTLSGRDSITTLVPTDIFLALTNASGFKNRQISWRLLRSNVSGYMDGIGLTWTAIQTFSGADFTTSAHGTVTFGDSTVFNAQSYHGGNYINASNLRSTAKVDGQFVGWIGSSALAYSRMYSTRFILMNSEGTDSISMSYDDSTLTIDKEVSFSENVTFASGLEFDSSKVFKNIVFGTYIYTIGNVTDTVLTLQDTCAIIDLLLPGDVTNMEKIEFASGQGKGIGTIIRIVWRDVAKSENTIFFEDGAPDGNLRLSADFTMAKEDYLELMQIYDQDGNLIWMETGRSNN